MTKKQGKSVMLLNLALRGIPIPVLALAFGLDQRVVRRILTAYGFKERIR